jgi:hypothetical protein
LRADRARAAQVHNLPEINHAAAALPREYRRRVAKREDDDDRQRD